MLWVREIVSDNEIVLESRGENGEFYNDIIATPAKVKKFKEQGEEIKGYVRDGLYGEYTYFFDRVSKHCLKPNLIANLGGCGAFGQSVTFVFDLKSVKFYVENHSGTVLYEETYRFGGETPNVSQVRIYATLGESSFSAISLIGGSVKSFVLPEVWTKIVRRKWKNAYLTEGNLWQGVPRLIIGTGVKDIIAHSMEGITVPEVFLFPDIQIIKDGIFYDSKIQYAEVGGSVEVLSKDVFNGSEQLSVVKLSDNVTEIGVSAFGYCFTLSKINLSKVQKIRNSAFHSTALEEINLESCEFLGQNVFYMCKRLKRFRGTPYTKLTRIGTGTFADTGLEAIQLSDFPTTLKSVESRRRWLNNVFEGCHQLQFINTNGMDFIPWGMPMTYKGSDINIPDNIVTMCHLKDCQTSNVVLGRGLGYIIISEISTAVRNLVILSPMRRREWDKLFMELAMQERRGERTVQMNVWCYRDNISVSSVMTFDTVNLCFIDDYEGDTDSYIMEIIAKAGKESIIQSMSDAEFRAEVTKRGLVY